MKQFFVLFFILSLTSCVKERMGNNNPKDVVPSGEKIDIVLGFENELTRTELNPSTLEIEFKFGDIVDVNGHKYGVTFDSSGNPVLRDVLMADTYTAVFSGSHSFLNSEDSNYKVSNLQVYTEGTFDPEAMPMLAYAADDGQRETPVSLNFTSLMGVMKLPVTGSSRIRTIKVEDTGNKYLAGRTTLNGSSDAATCLNVSTGTAIIPSVVMNCTSESSDGVRLSSAPTYFYIVLPAGTYDGGFKVTITDTDHLCNTYTTGTSTTITENVVTTMQPLEYAPEQDLVFAEYFDACVYGTDMVRLRSGAGEWRGLTPVPDGEQSGLKAENNSTGYERNMYYGLSSGTGVTREGTPGSDIFADWWDPTIGTDMEAAKSAGTLKMSESFIKSRGLWDWGLSRVIEYQGYIAIGNADAAHAAYSTTKTASPQGDCYTPKLTNLSGSSSVTLTLKVAAGVVNDFQKLCIRGVNCANMEFVYAAGGSTRISSSDVTYVSEENIKRIEIPVNIIPTNEWITVMVNVAGATAETYFRFCTDDGKNTSGDRVKTATFMIDDVRVTAYNGDIVPEEGATVSGTVSCDGVGVAGVVVTDGVNVVSTDADGRYYMNTDVPSADFIRVSVPSGYEVVNNAFYSKVTSSATQTHNFALKEVNQSEYTIITIADSHVLGGAKPADQAGANDRSHYLNKFIPSVKAYAETCTGPVYGIHLGDMTQTENWSSYDLNDYKSDTQLGFPLFNVIGNHDHDMGVTNGDATFKAALGPTYYSFNIGRRHFVVIDNMTEVVTTSGAHSSTACISSEQLAWLAKDIALLGSSGIDEIVVAAHIPMITSKTNVVSNADDLFSILEGYKLTFLAGHNHYDAVIKVTEGGRQVIQYIEPSLAGTNWCDDYLVCPDGTPASYVAYFCDGTLGMVRRIRPYDLTGDYALYRAINDATVSENSGTVSISLNSSKTYQVQAVDPSGAAASAVMVNVWGASTITAIADKGTCADAGGSRFDLAHRDWYVDWWNSISSSGKTPHTWHWSSASWHVKVFTSTEKEATFTVTAKDLYGNVIARFKVKSNR